MRLTWNIGGALLHGRRRTPPSAALPPAEPQQTSRKLHPAEVIDTLFDQLTGQGFDSSKLQMSDYVVMKLSASGAQPEYEFASGLIFLRHSPQGPDVVALLFPRKISDMSQLRIGLIKADEFIREIPASEYINGAQSAAELTALIGPYGGRAAGAPGQKPGLDEPAPGKA